MGDTELYYKSVLGAHWFLRIIRHEKDVEILAHARLLPYGYTVKEYEVKLKKLMDEIRGEFNIIEAEGIGRFAIKVELIIGLTHNIFSVRNPLSIFHYSEEL
jgi:hypothetical protein